MVGVIAWATQDAPDGSVRAGRLLDLLVSGLRHGGPRSAAGAGNCCGDWPFAPGL
jgi:hypothetical protein